MSDPVSMTPTSFDVSPTHWTIVNQRTGEVVFNRPGGSVGLVVDSEGYRDVFEQSFPLIVARWGTGQYVLNLVVDNAALGRIGNMTSFWEAPDLATAQQARKEISAGFVEPSFITNKIGACAPGPKPIRVCSGDVTSSQQGEQSVVVPATSPKTAVATPVRPEEAQPFSTVKHEVVLKHEPPASYSIVANALWGMLYHPITDFKDYVNDVVESTIEALPKADGYALDDDAGNVRVTACPEWVEGVTEAIDVNIKALSYIGKSDDSELTMILSEITNKLPNLPAVILRATRMHTKLFNQTAEEVLRSIQQSLSVKPQIWHYGGPENKIYMNRVLRAYMYLVHAIAWNPASAETASRVFLEALIIVRAYEKRYADSHTETAEGSSK